MTNKSNRGGGNGSEYPLLKTVPDYAAVYDTICPYIDSYLHEVEQNIAPNPITRETVIDILGDFADHQACSEFFPEDATKCGHARLFYNQLWKACADALGYPEEKPDPEFWNKIQAKYGKYGVKIESELCDDGQLRLKYEEVK